MHHNFKRNEFLMNENRSCSLASRSYFGYCTMQVPKGRFKEAPEQHFEVKKNQFLLRISVSLAKPSSIRCSKADSI